MKNLHEGSRGRTSLGKERRRGVDVVQAHGGVPIGSPTPTSPSTSERVLSHGSDNAAAGDLLAGSSPPYLNEYGRSLPLVVVDLLGWDSLNFSIHTSHLEREREDEEDVEQQRQALVFTSREKRHLLISSSR
ncbi:hypothetical protein ZWY2020_037922 [Hordeum vulgare]|nr:hypothetical protein ZWY2020_037922 [Hordeum vulgare]